ncbi:MAG: hypothetical protein RL417_273 [Pseudomonadota bacterium]|jgi:hypothetical protein
MITVIVIENGASQSSLQKTVGAVTASPSDNIIVVGSRPEELNVEHLDFITPDGASISSLLQRAAAQAKHERILFIDARSRIDSRQLIALMNSTNGRLGAMAYASLEISGECISMPELSVDSLVSTLTTQTGWPTAFVTMRTSFARRFLPNSSGTTLSEVMAEAMVQATLDGEEVERLNSQMEISSFDITSADCTLSQTRMAALLKTVVNNCNIEDLFPQHAWKEHQEESAAAAYHSLAALFVRFGDTDSALECLSLSDQLEDSPRSLALKGIIAFDRGETLGAVANLVSSLQQYELRKKSDGSHYLSFTPNNLERINSNLNAGLQALNKRNNEEALEHFAEAVNDFDTFYSEYGVKMMK